MVPSPEDTPDAEESSGFRVSLSNFDGPFDLLLNLISKHEMDITEVSLSAVTNEFIAYLKELDDSEELDQASEFLVVAATLLDMKVAGLLPQGELVDAEAVALLETHGDDAKVLALGGDVTWRATPALAFTVGAMWLDQDQERPDASAYEWNQTRLNARITYVLSSSDKRATGVPGVIERMPSMTGMGR